MDGNPKATYMGMQFRLWVILLCLQFAWLRPVHCAEVNRNAINTLYFGGELSAVKDILLPLLESGETFSKSDSIFIYKNLSVVMAAEPASRAKAQAYMYKLFVLAPSVDIIDMFVSDTIYMMFQNVRKEYLNRVSYNKSKEKIESTGGDALSPPGPAKNAKPEKSNSKWVLWTLGGVTIAGGVALYILMDQNPEVPERKLITNCPEPKCS